MIKVICVGKIKEKYFVDAIREYEKRLTKYAKLQIIEVDDVASSNPIISLKKEKELILKHINSKDYIITMDINGKKMDSVSFSKNLDFIISNNSNIIFIIGGSYGVDDEIKEISDLLLSFSDMTFPHQLFRVFLLEQLYRAFKINNNEKYHK